MDELENAFSLLPEAFPSLIGRLWTPAIAPVIRSISRFPSLIGRLWTTRLAKAKAARSPFPSLIGRLWTSGGSH